MKFAFTLVALFLSTAAQAHSQIPSYKANITRDGVTQVRVIQSFWSGEYPGPVVDINAKSKGTTAIPVYKSLRDLSGKTTCNVKNGVYHEWSNTNNSVRDYYAIIALEEYMALNDVKVDDVENPHADIILKKGGRLTEVVYFAEGYVGAVVENGSTRTKVVLDNNTYGDLTENKSLKLTSTRATHGDERPLYEQWIRVKCEDGRKLFANVDELLRTKGVQEGTILEYGRAGRADETYE